MYSSSRDRFWKGRPWDGDHKYPSHDVSGAGLYDGDEQYLVDDEPDGGETDGGESDGGESDGGESDGDEMSQSTMADWIRTSGLRRYLCLFAPVDFPCAE